ncbi:hypothetical protein GCM10009764_75240 [Nocardia ninae]|uniref:Adenosine deaminase domain-containing protein n=2 Tax=Nocardia ninae TaxID=356145 RepID=A0A511MUP6_9NOCA|nr:hypothetical protein NN4_88520 [Nocardia ninae NBRC 108245]
MAGAVLGVGLYADFIEDSSAGADRDGSEEATIKIPRYELHCHFDGPATVAALAREQGIALDKPVEQLMGAPSRGNCLKTFLGSLHRFSLSKFCKLLTR